MAQRKIKGSRRAGQALGRARLLPSRTSVFNNRKLPPFEWREVLAERGIHWRAEEGEHPGNAICRRALDFALIQENLGCGSFNRG